MIIIFVRQLLGLRNLHDLIPTRQDMLGLAAEAIDIIKKRTLAGTDIDGGRFAKYSPSYKKRREDTGRTTSVVNLSFHGDMLRSMAYRPISNGAAIFFRDAERSAIARYHNDGLGVPQRQFFGLSDAELQRLSENLSETLSKRLRERAKQ